MLEPLSDKERVSIAILTLIDPETATANERQVHEWIGSYEATVKNRDERIAALETEVARLRPLAEVGEAVEGMAIGDLLWRVEHGWYTYKNAVNTRQGMERDGVGFDESSPVIALAALRVAKGRT